MDIFVDTGGLIILKQDAVADAWRECAERSADAIHDATAHVALITDRDTVVAVAGALDLLDMPAGQCVREAMASGRTITHRASDPTPGALGGGPTTGSGSPQSSSRRSLPTASRAG